MFNQCFRLSPGKWFQFLLSFWVRISFDDLKANYPLFPFSRVRNFFAISCFEYLKEILCVLSRFKVHSLFRREKSFAKASNNFELYFFISEPLLSPTLFRNIRFVGKQMSLQKTKLHLTRFESFFQPTFLIFHLEC